MSSFDITFTIPQAEIQKVTDAIRAKMMIAVDWCTDTISTYARENHAYTNRTHNLTTSTKFLPAMQEGSSIVGLVYVGMPYAKYVHWGTGIYGPQGKAWDVEGKLQVFQVNGQTVFTRKTHHEGQKSDPWVAKAFKDKRADCIRVLRGCL
jgi:hypothetical protein